MLGDSFFLFLFLLVYSIGYATSLITNLGEQYSLAFVDKKSSQKMTMFQSRFLLGIHC